MNIYRSYNFLGIYWKNPMVLDYIIIKFTHSKYNIVQMDNKNYSTQ